MQNADGQVLIRAELDASEVFSGIEAMKTAMSKLEAFAAARAASIRRQTQSEGAALTSWIGGLAGRLIGSLSAGLSGGGVRLGGALRTSLSAAWNNANNYITRFSGIGSAVIGGIISGIQGRANALWNTLRTVADRMLSTLKDALGIRSPSRLMREEVGAQIGAGIAQGLSDSTETVARAAGALAKTAQDAAQSAVSGAVAFSAPRVSADAGDGQNITDMHTASQMLTAPHSPAGMRETGRSHIPEPAAVQTDAVPLSLTGAAVMLRHAVQNASVPASVSPAVLRTPEETDTVSASRTEIGQTFVFQKPVETPHRYAKAIRDAMEVMLYGA